MSDGPQISENWPRTIRATVPQLWRMTVTTRKRSTIVIGLVFLLMGLICLHLLDEVYRLESARERLGKYNF
jgi:hypothetical protein